MRGFARVGQGAAGGPAQGSARTHQQHVAGVRRAAGCGWMTAAETTVKPRAGIRRGRLTLSQAIRSMAVGSRRRGAREQACTGSRVAEAVVALLARRWSCRPAARCPEHLHAHSARRDRRSSGPSIRDRRHCSGGAQLLAKQHAATAAPSWVSSTSSIAPANGRSSAAQQTGAGGVQERRRCGEGRPASGAQPPPEPRRLSTALTAAGGSLDAGWAQAEVHQRATWRRLRRSRRRAVRRF